MDDLQRQQRRELQRKKRKRKVLIIEIVILAALALVLGVSIWATQKLSLVKRQEINSEQLKTADEYNSSQKMTESQETNVSSQNIADPTITPVAADTSGSEYVAEDLSGMDIIALVGLDTRLTLDDGENSDTMMLCCINHNAKTIKLVSIYRDTYLNLGDYYDGTHDYYAKANEAYNIGGPTQFLSMLNLNLDLNLKEYVTVDFRALAYAIDVLGGLDVEMTRQELIHMNNYNVETSKVCEVDYEEIPDPENGWFDGERKMTFHLSGSQAVSYARIRYTDGGDYRRASRQREILRLVKEKAMSADLGTIDHLLNTVLPYVTTNLDNGKILSLATDVISYNFDQDDASGFPQIKWEDDGELTGTDCIVPVTLKYNVQLLHNCIFGADTGYVPSGTVEEYSDHITEVTGLGEKDIPGVSEIDYHEALTTWSEEAEAANKAAAAAAGYTEESSSDEQDYSSDGEDYSTDGEEYYPEGEDYSQEGEDYSQEGEDYSTDSEESYAEPEY